MVECDLAKVEVAGSNPVSRSIFKNRMLTSSDCFTKPAKQICYGHVRGFKEVLFVAEHKTIREQSVC